MIELYDFELSGNCYKVRLMLSLLQQNYQKVMVNLANREQVSEAFISRNPFGQVPVLKEGDLWLRDSQAILVYLARKYGDAQWLPLDPVQLGQINAWLATAANEVARGPALLRIHYKFGREINLADASAFTAKLMQILQHHLSHQQWLVGDHATIADIAIYPYVALAHEGKVDLTAYPAIIAWIKRIQALPNYVGMPGLWQVSACQ
ncbi:MAG TPA: glutathione S-transferase [Pseudomonadales bacterium]|nr:glutathione S-transferase [Pseudomonadales bacterium]